MEILNTPQCVGFIMDGNRRWAKAQGLKTFDGHAKGYEVLQELITAVHAANIPHMVCYAFSTENWKRTEDEVGYLMNLLKHAFSEFRKKRKTDTRRINIRVIGERERLSPVLQDEISFIEEQNYDDPELTVWIAFSYGGRAEIVDAVNRAYLSGQKITEESFGSFLWTKDMPDPDLVIRTSGEERLSNFLLWQTAYSELFFTKTLWPDFGESEFQSILEQYTNRKRRIGK
ncbi:MAG: di-trans,poly-cis-decaprenylcistransferase [Candidatus Pacebacteria bacterium]|nr:di-trans,poly-cis-decaprenylcistransferase [Candidatus Paceibacterota bacterium]MCF7857615.1 di-trans,poly-cis-decaprenylcistransferase [Candidatus Paceibacterota bacterium]